MAVTVNSDLKAANIEDPNNNLSNYDKKNKGSLNKKVLVSKEINGEIFYTFDEQLFDWQIKCRFVRLSDLKN